MCANPLLAPLLEFFGREGERRCAPIVVWFRGGVELDGGVGGVRVRESESESERGAPLTLHLGELPQGAA